jgi:hypothetical protein
VAGESLLTFVDETLSQLSDPEFLLAEDNLCRISRYLLAFDAELVATALAEQVLEGPAPLGKVCFKLLLDFVERGVKRAEAFYRAIAQRASLPTAYVAHSPANHVIPCPRFASLPSSLLLLSELIHAPKTDFVRVCQYFAPPTNK